MWRQPWPTSSDESNCAGVGQWWRVESGLSIAGSTRTCGWERDAVWAVYHTNRTAQGYPKAGLSVVTSSPSLPFIRVPCNEPRCVRVFLKAAFTAAPGPPFFAFPRLSRCESHLRQVLTSSGRWCWPCFDLTDIKGPASAVLPCQILWRCARAGGAEQVYCRPWLTTMPSQLPAA